MKKIALGLLLLSSSALCVKLEDSPVETDFICRTGTLIIQNDSDRVLAVYKNIGSKNSSCVTLKPTEMAQFETDKDNEKVMLEIMQYGQKRRVTVEGQVLEEDRPLILHISFLYAGS